MKRQKTLRFPFFGIALILLGTGLLLDRLGYLNFGWDKIFSVGLMLFGAGLTWRAFMFDERGKVFFATMSFLFGLLLFLTSTHLVIDSPALVLPSVLLIIGFSFIMIFVLDTHEWGVLIPGIILTALGGTFMLSRLGYVQVREIIDAGEIYWPLLLILIGAGMLLRRRRVGVPSIRDDSMLADEIKNT